MILKGKFLFSVLQKFFKVLPATSVVKTGTDKCHEVRSRPRVGFTD